MGRYRNIVLTMQTEFCGVNRILIIRFPRCVLVAYRSSKSQKIRHNAAHGSRRQDSRKQRCFAAFNVLHAAGQCYAGKVGKRLGKIDQDHTAAVGKWLGKGWVKVGQYPRPA